MRVLLINYQSKTNLVVRDMAGGIGFDGGEGAILPPLDLAYMAATLMLKGNEVKIIDSVVEDYADNDIYKIVREYAAQAIISVVSLPSLYQDCSFLKELRRHSSAVIIAKTGIAYNQILREILERSAADICIYGECDMDIDEIIKGAKIQGTAYLKDGKLIIEEARSISNLDLLPLPARNLLHNEKYRYILLGDKVTTMQTSRGCPYPCYYYCPYPLIQGRIWRCRSPEHVVREIEDIVNNYRIKKILFRDATFTLDKERVKNICRLLLEKRLDIIWWCETRVDCLDREIMAIMKKAGCRGMNIGVETGDSELMRKQAKVGLTIEKLKFIIKSACELKLRLHLLLMIGLPEETKKSLYQTYRLIRNLKPESIGVCIVTPYPVTPLYEQAKQKGWIESEDWTRFGGHYPVMHTDNFSAKDLLKAHQMIIQGFNLSKRGLLGRIRLLLLDYRFREWARR